MKVLGAAWLIRLLFAPSCSNYWIHKTSLSYSLKLNVAPSDWGNFGNNQTEVLGELISGGSIMLKFEIFRGLRSLVPHQGSAPGPCWGARSAPQTPSFKGLRYRTQLYSGVDPRLPPMYSWYPRDVLNTHYTGWYSLESMWTPVVFHETELFRNSSWLICIFAWVS